MIRAVVEEPEQAPSGSDRPRIAHISVDAGLERHAKGLTFRTPQHQVYLEYLLCVRSYVCAIGLGAPEEWAFRLSSATPKASSSNLASWAMFHTWAIITGQKTSAVITVGIAC